MKETSCGCCAAPPSIDLGMEAAGFAATLANINAEADRAKAEAQKDYDRTCERVNAQRIAEKLKAQYDAYITVGFSEEQAWELIRKVAPITL